MLTLVGCGAGGGRAEPATTVGTAPPPPPGAVVDVARVVTSYPHDRAAFTEGLVYSNGTLYESTGLEGRSTLRQADLTTGIVQRVVPLDPRYFGEGIALLDGQLFQLTWKSHLGFVYRESDFRVQRTWRYEQEGWGLTTDGRQLIMSSGTDQLFFVDPRTLKTTRTVRVQDRGTSVRQLNSLQYIEGEVWANVFPTDYIVRIDPRSGRVKRWVLAESLLSSSDRTPPVDVLNGIAYDATRRRILVTGKLWPKVFAIRLSPEKA